VEAEMRGMEEQLDSVLGYEYKIRLMRPPFGSIYGDRLRTAKRLEQCGYPYIILWSISQTDPKKMLAQVQNGDILLYHSYRKDVEGLRKAIPVLLERGYELVTVSELLGLNENEAEPTPEMQKIGVKLGKTTCHDVQNMLR
jgi:peptidoglycan/xylan/chitin deacetylase (PgdA/CDA1 family)